MARNKEKKAAPEVKPEHKHEFKNRKEKIGWYIDEIDSYKEDMGMWYTVFIRRILPFMIFVLPFAVIWEHLYPYICYKFFDGILSPDDQYLPWAVFAVSLVLFLAILILLPRFATFCEFVISALFYYYVFSTFSKFAAGLIQRPVITSAAGYTLAIGLGLFMFMKLVFLVLEIVYMIVFRHEKAPKTFVEDDDFVV